MELRPLGRSGLRVSAIGLGGNTFGQTIHGEDAATVVHAAIDSGITLVDTADMYSGGRSEELIGQALGSRRQQVILATKVRHPVTGAPHEGGLSRRWLMQAVEESLRRLRTDYIDLYQLHAPDAETPIEETLRTVDDLVRQGKVRYLGCSNFAAWEVALGLSTAKHWGLPGFVSAQNRWNLLEGIDDPQLPAACCELGVGVIAYSALGSGILTGKYQRGVAPPPGTRAGDMPHVAARIQEWKLDAVDRLRPWAAERGRSPAELALAWLLAQKATSSVLVGARDAAQVSANLKALEWKLEASELTEIEHIAAGEAAARAR